METAMAQTTKELEMAISMAITTMVAITEMPTVLTTMEMKMEATTETG